MPIVPPNTPGIYKITCTANKKIYIGSARKLRTRRNEHWRALRAGKHINTYLQHAWNKYGEDAFTFEVLELVMFVEHLIEREQYYLATLRPYDKAIGFNITHAAGSTLGRMAGPETRKKISEKAQGRAMSEEARQKISRANRGRKFTPEHRRNMSIAQQNRPPTSEEARQKMSKTRKGRSLTDEHRAKIAVASRGRKHSDEAREKLRAARQKQAPVSEEARRKISEKARNRSPETHRRMSEGQKRRDPTTFFPVAEAMRNRPGVPRHIVTTPDGEELLVCLTDFCKEHGLTYRCMYNIISGRQKTHRGYTVRRAIELSSK